MPLAFAPIQFSKSLVFAIQGVSPNAAVYRFLFAFVQN
jgi:hypothetical protein